MKEISINNARMIQKSILNDVDRFCKENELRYFLIGGTLLGAVRHKGFIPWDDDIDIAMLRSDYERFIAEYKSVDCYLAYHGLFDGYSLPYVKICRKNTVVEDEQKITENDIGINIDLFPIDYVPNGRTSQKTMLAINNFYKDILILKWGIPLKSFTSSKQVRRLFQVLLKVFPYSFLLNRINRNAARYNSAGTLYCANIIWGIGTKEIVSKSVFENNAELEFDGQIYMAPIGWDEWLTKRYGNYMTPPPKDKQVNPHPSKYYAS